MKREKINAYAVLKRVKEVKPVVHHLTNWVTIYDCAQIVKVLGASPVMAHAKEEAAQMAGIASSLVLNIGTLTVDFVEAMKIAALSANKKGIPVVLDVCGAGSTSLRDEKSFELLGQTHIDIIKGNASEIARIAGKDTKTKGVDASVVAEDMFSVAVLLAKERSATIVVTGKTDIITDGRSTYVVKNGHEMMTKVVGTGCMASSVVGAFAAVEKDLALAATSALVCFEIAAERAAKNSSGPASFKEHLFDYLYGLDKKTIDIMQRVESSRML